MNVPNRTFDVDAYLDSQLKAPQHPGCGPRFSESEIAYLSRVYSDTDIAELVAIRESQHPSFRGWVVRLNDRIERWMDSVDWRRIDIWLGNVGGFFLTGFSLYLLFIVLNAWLSGAIERAVR